MSITLKINTKQVSVEEGATILDAARAAGIYIPTLCYDSRLEPYGACRMCIVEEKNRPGKLIPSCFTPARNGMDIVTDTPEIIAARRTQLQLMLINHPLDCPVCDKAGECALQDLVVRYQITDSPYKIEKVAKPVDHLSAFIERDMNRCILCGRCVRICSELQDRNEIDFMNRGIETIIGTDGGRPLACDFCGQCISTCPVGALTDKLFKNTTRNWKLAKKETVCSHCGLGCRIDMGIENGTLRRITAPVSDQGDIGNLCVRGRFGWSSYQSPDRLKTPLIRGSEGSASASWSEAVRLAAEKINKIRTSYGNGSFAVVSSDIWTTEEAYAYQKFCRTIMDSEYMCSVAAEGYRQLTQILTDQVGDELRTGSMKDFEDADVLLIIGGGATDLHPVLKPMINTFLRKKGRELVVISTWKDYLLQKATIPLEINPLLREEFFSQLREALSGNTNNNHSDVACFGLDCSSLAKFVTLLEGQKKILLMIVPYLFGNNEQLGKLASYLHNRMKAVLPLGAQCNSRGSLLHAGFGAGMLPGGLPARCHNNVFTGISDILGGIEKGTIRGLYIVGDDPLEQYPDPKRMMTLLKQLDFLLFQSPYESSVASLADIVLPSATLPEKSGYVISLFGTVNNVRATLPKPAYVKTDLEIVRELAATMGFDSDDFSPDRIENELPEYIHCRLTSRIAGTGIPRNEITWGSQETRERSDDFPFMMIPVPSQFGDSVISRQSSALASLNGGFKILMNPADSARYDLADHAAITIASPFGISRAKLEISQRVREKTVLAINIMGNPDGLSLLREHQKIVPVNITRMNNYVR